MSTSPVMPQAAGKKKDVPPPVGADSIHPWLCGQVAGLLMALVNVGWVFTSGWGMINDILPAQQIVEGMVVQAAEMMQLSASRLSKLWVTEAKQRLAANPTPKNQELWLPPLVDCFLLRLQICNFEGVGIQILEKMILVCAIPSTNCGPSKIYTLDKFWVFLSPILLSYFVFPIPRILFAKNLCCELFSTRDISTC